MSDKMWKYLQIYAVVSAFLLIIIGLIILGERQADGAYIVPEQNIWTYAIIAYLGACALFIAVAQVRKRTGKKVTLKTVIIAILWILGVILFTEKIGSLRSG